ncbi:MFS transporter [Luteimonas sp. BDR2-5]|nr:MFS transporter [Luteimonas sp. BDR2-5]
MPATATTAAAATRLPLAGLLALACAGFVTILTEALPAGLLPQMAAGLGVRPALVGQLVTVYALGSLLAAIPLVVATRSWRRRRLLLAAIAGFLVANTVTALSAHYPLTLLARFVAGISAGLLWALLAGYASRLVAPALQGRAIAVAMVGTPLALSLGIPAGTLLGQHLGWRWTFGAMSLLSLGLLAWARIVLPDFPGTRGRDALRLREVFGLPGIAQVLTVMLLYVLAHNALYTYIVPVLALAGPDMAVERYLLLFGVMSLAGIWIVGTLIDRGIRRLLLASIAGFLLATAIMALSPRQPTVLAVATGLWGLAFGGVATLFQTALARRAGAAADLAQSMLVTGWNLAIAGGGLLGGMLLDHLGAHALVLAVLPLLLVSGALAAPRRGWA